MIKKKYIIPILTILATIFVINIGYQFLLLTLNNSFTPTFIFYKTYGYSFVIQQEVQIPVQVIIFLITWSIFIDLILIGIIFNFLIINNKENS